MLSTKDPVFFGFFDQKREEIRKFLQIFLQICEKIQMAWNFVTERSTF